MKKFTVISLAGLLILAFGATAYAQEPKLEFRASGFIDAQTHLSVNVPPLNPNATPIYNSLPADYTAFTPVQPAIQGYSNRQANAVNRQVSYWDSRMHLAFDMVMGKELSGRLMFEIDAGRWGGNNTGIANNVRDANGYGVWATDRAAAEVKYIYFDIGLPYFGIPVPMNVRVGAQPMAIRPWFYAATDGTGVSGGLKIDPVTINPFYFKPKEGVDWVNDDADIYGVQVSAKLGTFSVGGYSTYYNMNSYPMFVSSAMAGWYPAAYPQVSGTSNANMWWFGIYADGKLGPIDLNFDAGWDTGKVKPNGNSTAEHIHYNGWASRLKVDYPWEKFNFGVTGMYASGSDADKTSSTGIPGTTAANGQPSTRVNGWMVPVGSETGAANGESAVFYGMEAGASGGQGIADHHQYNQHSNGAFGGTWFAKLYGSYKITPWYKITLQGLYIGDTTRNGNTYGTARLNNLQPAGTAGGNTLLRDDKFIGVELDMLNEFQIYKNFTAKLFGGYMWAGNAMDLYSGSIATGNFEMKNPWAIRTRFMYSF